MCFGGNNRAQVFFKQHGWTDGGKIEGKYTSRAADLYRQLLAKEVAKTNIEEAGLPSSPVDSQSLGPSNGFSDIHIEDPKTGFEKEEPKESLSIKNGNIEVPAPFRASQTPSTTVKKTFGAKKIGKTGGLGARKLTTKASENLYDQKPEELPVQVSSVKSSNGSTPDLGSTFNSRFEYTDNAQSTEMSSGGARVVSHVTPPNSTNFFSDYGMGNGFSKKSSSNSSKLQVEETDEARKKFTNAKSISSAQFFGVQDAAKEADASLSLQKFSGSSSISSADLFGDDSNSSIDIAASELISKLSFQAQQDISSLKDMAGETGKKISSLASTFLTDFQDRIL